MASRSPKKKPEETDLDAAQTPRDGNPASSDTPSDSGSVPSEVRVDVDGTVPLEGGAASPLAAGDGAEEALVAAVLTDPARYDDVAELVSPEDFSVPVYRDLWEAICAADAQGRPIDSVTVADELERAKRLARVGGLEGIREICDRAADHPDHVEVYARLVADRSLRRRVLNIGRDIVAYTTREAADGADALAAAESAVLGVAMENRHDGPTPVAKAVPEMLAELAKARDRLLLGHSTGLRDLDRLTGGVQGGQLIIVAARPGMGKSGLALQLARNISESSGDMVAFVSYEMDTNELLVRALSAAMAIPLGELRRGTIPWEAETDLARHAQRLAALPLVIDDRPPLTITGLRSSMRRLARRGPLAAIIVDYLQLMGGDRFVASQNRTAEVSEISRGLKLLARELDVPVIALSQLNRLVEQRPNKRPMLSDLRESGCLVAETRILRADTGAEITIGELAASGERNIEVWSLDEDWKMVRRTLTHAFSSGEKEVFELRLASGRTVTASANHPFRTLTGWEALENLRVGGRIAVPRRVGEPSEPAEMDDNEVVLLAQLCSIDEQTREKGIPRPVFGLPSKQVALFLQHLWSANGTVAASPSGTHTKYPTRSRQLADDVARLLTRFGVVGRIDSTPSRVDGRNQFHVEVAGGDEQDRFPSAASGARDEEHEALADGDVFWDEITAIESVGRVETFDATVPGTHNFVANGIVVHNSIEQDADTVWMVYRDHVYNPESDPQAAEIIVVKQRQGAQGTVHTEFDGALGARFRDRPEGWTPEPAGPEPLRRGGQGGEPW